MVLLDQGIYKLITEEMLVKEWSHVELPKLRVRCHYYEREETNVCEQVVWIVEVC
jgi:hypothetical protein